MNLGIGWGYCDDLAANVVWDIKYSDRHFTARRRRPNLHIRPPIPQFSFTQKSANRNFAETSRNPYSSTQLNAKKPRIKHYFQWRSGTCNLASCAYFCREFYTIRKCFRVFPLFVEESDLERIGVVTDVTLVSLLTVDECTDKDKFCTADLAGLTDQIKQTSFRCQIIDKVGPSAISLIFLLAEEYWESWSSW